MGYSIYSLKTLYRIVLGAALAGALIIAARGADWMVAVGVILLGLPAWYAGRLLGHLHRGARGNLAMLRTLMYAVDAEEPYTRGLSYRVSKISARIARHLGLSPEEVESVEYAALLHDIGRIAIKRDILARSGGLSREELVEVRAHPRIGYHIAADLGLRPDVSRIILNHHEQPDGKGYPRGVLGAQIPAGSRIIMAVAAFDAMTSDRPYRRGMSPQEACEELLEHAGSQFFPEVVQAIVDLYETGELFQDLDDELTRTMGEEGLSRAVEEYLVRMGAATSMPHKRGTDIETFAMTDLNTLDISGLDLCPDEPETQIMKKSFLLDDDAGLQLLAAGISDVGCMRSNNEDTFGIFPGDTEDAGCLVVVADGMGGAAGGEVASRMAVDKISDVFLAADGSLPVGDRLRDALEEANQDIHAAGENDPGLTGMGTTCTAAVFRRNKLHLAHVGDSRGYLIRGGGIRLLTQDHTLAVELQRISGDPEAMSGTRHVLTRCLGAEVGIQVDFPSEVQLQPEDTLVLCSDGLTSMVNESEILSCVLEHEPDEAGRQLVQLARSRGGPDNITVQVARVVKLGG